MQELTSAFSKLDPRVALVVFLFLLLGAAIPLVLAWYKLLPDEPDPFDEEDHPEPKPFPHDKFAIFLLANVSISFLATVPGVLKLFPFAWIEKIIPENWSEHVASGAMIWLIFVPLLAVAYSAVRTHTIRKWMMFGGVLTFLLWPATRFLLIPITGIP